VFAAACFLMCCVAFSLAASSGARHVHTTRVEQVDPADAGLPLDVKEVDSLADGDRLRFSIVTWHRWRPRALHDRAFIVLLLYTRPGGGPDFSALVRSNGRHLRGVLLRGRGGGRERRVGSFPVWRNDLQSVSLRLPREKLDLQPGAGYSWHVQTIMTSLRCKRVCFDRVPDQGTVAEVLPPAGPPGPSAANRLAQGDADGSLRAYGRGAAGGTRTPKGFRPRRPERRA
jgi:hypothetical protein